jgi:hypothetical protein
MFNADGSPDIVSHRRRHCDCHPSDEKYLEKFQEELNMLTGMVREMLVENKQLLLSPVMRKMLEDKAALVRSMHLPLRNKLVVDNPGTPLIPHNEYEP